MHGWMVNGNAAELMPMERNDGMSFWVMQGLVQGISERCTYDCGGGGGVGDERSVTEKWLQNFTQVQRAYAPSTNSMCAFPLRLPPEPMTPCGSYPYVLASFQCTTETASLRSASNMHFP